MEQWAQETWTKEGDSLYGGRYEGAHAPMLGAEDGDLGWAGSLSPARIGRGHSRELPFQPRARGHGTLTAHARRHPAHLRPQARRRGSPPTRRGVALSGVLAAAARAR